MRVTGQAVQCVVVELTVPPGKWTTAGRIIDCPIGTYNPLSGQTFATACRACPEFSTTPSHSATSVSECICMTGFQQTIDRASGSAICECAAGFEIVNGVRCEPCPLATFKDFSGNVKCIDCPIEGATTTSEGAETLERCVCDVGMYALPRLMADEIAALAVPEDAGSEGDKRRRLAEDEEVSDAPTAAASLANGSLVASDLWPFRCAPCRSWSGVR